jgi:WS/DGAT/MGAT family acyltransferase
LSTGSRREGREGLEFKHLEPGGVNVIDRLSLLDEAFLRLEEPSAPMHVAWTLLVEGEPPPLEQLRRRVAGRLERLPRLRRRVLTSRLHRPLWIDDSEFDLRHHVVRARLPRPGAPTELRGVVGRLLSEPLDLNRPLWRLHLLVGLRDGGFAIVCKAHHALVDGLGAVEAAQVLLDDAHAKSPGEVGDARPAPPPTLVEQLLTAGVEQARAGGALLSLGVRSLANPRRAAGASRRIVGTLAPYALQAAPETILNGSAPARSTAFIELPLRAAQAISERELATVDDVALAVGSLALGRYLLSRRDHVPRLRALVPVSTRPAGEATTLGNRISFVLVDLPVGQHDPRAALAEVACQTAEHRRLGSARVLDGVLPATCALPLPLRDRIARYATRPKTFNVVLSNVPGPMRPASVLGRPVRAAYPALPLSRGQGLSIGVLTYRDALHVGLVAAPRVVPDVEALGIDFTRAFEALRLATLRGPRSSPRGKPAAGRTSGRTRRRLAPV